MVKRNIKKSSIFPASGDQFFPCAPPGVFSKAKCDPDPKSKGGPGPFKVLCPVVSPGSNFGSGSVSRAKVPTEILASEM